MEIFIRNTRDLQKEGLSRVEVEIEGLHLQAREHLKLLASTKKLLGRHGKDVSLRASKRN